MLKIKVWNILDFDIIDDFWKTNAFCTETSRSYKVLKTQSNVASFRGSRYLLKNLLFCYLPIYYIFLIFTYFQTK